MTVMVPTGVADVVSTQFRFISFCFTQLKGYHAQPLRVGRSDPANSEICNRQALQFGAKITCMAAQNIVDIPPCHPGMADIHRRATNAFRAHWRAHGAALPKKLILTQQQADDLHLCRLYGCVPMPGVKPEQGKFNGSPIEVSESTAGVLVAHDGTEMPLADFDQLAPA